MKNILLITSLYPSDDVKFLNNTAVCHYFAKEWHTLGYNVRVIYCYRTYSWYYYPLLRLFRNFLSNKVGIAILDKRVTEVINYRKDGVEVSLIPVFKGKPFGRFKKKETDKCADAVIGLLCEENFKPDLILGHFIHPALEIVTKLKETYKVPVTLSLHGKETVFSQEDANMLQSVDYMGYRSYPIKRSFETLYGERPFFMCPSGVPREYIACSPRFFAHGVHNFIYVGTLMQRKYPACIVEALSSIEKYTDYSVTYIGDGDEIKHIKRLADGLGVSDKVFFTGRIPRDEIQAYLDKSDVFIMISKNETFGLVYLEAMARGCVVIAAKDEGMDGIIQDGVNGFLCTAGDAKELSEVIQRIISLDEMELNKISESSRQTALQYTDTNVAKAYIEYFEK